MEFFVVFQQMMVLLAMMAVGFFMFQSKWLDESSCGHISKLCVNILNPCLIISGSIGKPKPEDPTILLQNLALVVVYFLLLILLSIPVVKTIGVKKDDQALYRMMLIFSNVGFMGIPVISSIMGEESIIYITFYMMGYNFLLYTYGFMILSPDGQGGMNWKRMINVGTVSGIIAILIFVFEVPVPKPGVTFFNYCGNAVVPLSMMLIGASVAQHASKEFFKDIKICIFSVIKLLVIPIVCALLIRFLNWPELLKGIFVMMLAMPVGSIVVMVAKETGADDKESTKGSVLTTIASLITIPIVALFL